MSFIDILIGLFILVLGFVFGMAFLARGGLLLGIVGFALGLGLGYWIARGCVLILIKSLEFLFPGTKRTPKIAHPKE